MFKPNGKPQLILETLLLISLLALTSCRTCPESASESPQPPAIPSVAWPTFPDPTGKVTQLPDGRVVMSLDYWLAVTGYVIDVEAGIDTIEAYRR